MDEAEPLPGVRTMAITFCKWKMKAEFDSGPPVEKEGWNRLVWILQYDVDLILQGTLYDEAKFRGRYPQKVEITIEEFETKENGDSVLHLS